MSAPEEVQVRQELSGDFLDMRKEMSCMFDNIDSFLVQSRDNSSVTKVGLFPFDSDPGNYEFWDKVGQIIGNLTELNSIRISFLPHSRHYDDDGVTIRRPDWEIFTRILTHLRQKVTLSYLMDDNYAEVEDIQGLARAIHGHPMISKFTSSDGFTFENVGPWCSALVALPSLEDVEIGFQEPESEEQRVLLNVEPLKELLRAPALRFVRFNGCYFTNELCYAIGNALEEGSSIIDILFGHQCTFPAGGRAIIAKALKTNASVVEVQFRGDCDEPLCDTLAAVLLCNSTLQKLTLWLPEEGAAGRWLCPIFLSLAMNTTLKSLCISTHVKLGDKLCAAISNGLAKNSTLEELSLHSILARSGDDGAVSARNALPFLRTNFTLKYLTVSFAQNQHESYVSAFRLEAVKMLENTFLKRLTINCRGSCITFEEFLALISALRLNTTLKTLGNHSFDYTTVDQVNQLVSILKKNYGLECLAPDIPCAADDGRVKAILRLNAAGRRYLIKDGSSVSKGVDVLSAVSDEIDCVFLHLLENPSLCDRRAADTTTGRQRPGSNLDESSSSSSRLHRI
jgi:hypothetical protein